MPIYRHRRFLISTVFFLLCFSVLFSMRLGLLNGSADDPPAVDPAQSAALADRDTWMSIYQNDRKIGFAHKTFSDTPNGFVVAETVFMRVNTLGMVQDIRIETRGSLDPHLGLSSFHFRIDSGRFQMKLQGRVRDGVLILETDSGDGRRQQEIAVQTPLHLTTTLVDAARARGLQPGARYTLPIFDPMSLGQSTVTVAVVEFEEIQIDAGRFRAAKLLLNFKGADQFAWVGPGGEVVKEKGLLGIELEKSSRSAALAGISTDPGDDLARLASVKSNRRIPEPAALALLQVEIRGPAAGLPALRGGRQQFSDGVLTVRKESLEGLPARLDADRLSRMETVFLQPSLHIRSDHKRIEQQVDEILPPDGKHDLPTAARRLVDWVYRNIEKRPVISVPDALATLERRQGDCNEHAVLLAALARAAGIPARIETGLAYMNGRFYYHAWNLLYLGRWVTADAAFGQLPADVTHIRLASGHQNSFELLGTLDRLQVEVISTAGEAPTDIGAGDG